MLVHLHMERLCARVCLSVSLRDFRCNMAPSMLFTEGGLDNGLCGSSHKCVPRSAAGVACLSMNQSELTGDTDADTSTYVDTYAYTYMYTYGFTYTYTIST